MDYPWYFPQNNGGGNNNNAMKTKTITVTEDILTTSAELADITKETFAYSVESFEVLAGIESPVTISTDTEFEENKVIFTFNWKTAFNGYININYWEKTE